MSEVKKALKFIGVLLVTLVKNGTWTLLVGSVKEAWDSVYGN